jgi:hypothetical protein
MADVEGGRIIVQQDSSALTDSSHPQINPITRKLFAETDWTNTSLGPIEQWSPNLRVAADLCLSSLFSCILWFGPHLNFIYNDVSFPFTNRRYIRTQSPDPLCYLLLLNVTRPSYYLQQITQQQ